jgi:hypothetical protein
MVKATAPATDAAAESLRAGPRWPLSVTLIAVTGAVKAVTGDVTVVTRGRDPSAGRDRHCAAVTAVAGGLPPSPGPTARAPTYQQSPLTLPTSQPPPPLPLLPFPPILPAPSHPSTPFPLAPPSPLSPPPAQRRRRSRASAGPVGPGRAGPDFLLLYATSPQIHRQVASLPAQRRRRRRTSTAASPGQSLDVPCAEERRHIFYSCGKLFHQKCEFSFCMPISSYNTPV